MTQRHGIGQKCIPRRRSFGCTPIATTQTNTLVSVLDRAKGLNAGFLGRFALSYRHCLAEPASQPPTLHKFRAGGWEVKQGR